MSSSPLMPHALSWHQHPYLLWSILASIGIACILFLLLRRNRTLARRLDSSATRLAHTEAENWQLQAALLAAQKLEDWGRMSAVVTHEIANPLEAIQNILYLIRQSGDATPELIRLTRMASQEADRILTISRSTLSFFRQSSTPERVDLRAAAESVRFLLDPLLRRRQVTLNIKSHGDATVHASAGELRQVLLNLIRNACEASSRGGSNVAVTLAGLADYVEIIVADQGPGIAPELVPAIFQFGHSTKGPHGNGMGLWTVKHIVDKHGGEIRVDSQPGHGATFTVTWPRHIPPAQNRPRPTHTLRPVNA